MDCHPIYHKQIFTVHFFVCVFCGGSWAATRRHVENVNDALQSTAILSDTCAYTQVNNCTPIDKFNTYTGEMPYICSECSRAFRHESTLTTHMKTHNRAAASDCKFELLYKYYFVIAAMHSCTVCNRVVMSRGALKVHMRVHTQQTPYECNVCAEVLVWHCALIAYRLVVNNSAPLVNVSNTFAKYTADVM